LSHVFVNLGCKFSVFLANMQKNDGENAFFFKNIWSIQFFVVLLHPLSKNKKAVI